MSKVKPLNEIIIGLVCLLFLASGVFCFAADTQIKLQMSPFPAPSNLTATVVSSERIDLNWSPVSIAVCYKVYRDGVLIASPTTNSYSDTGLAPGTTYSYAISAVNIDGAESPQSSSVSVTISAGGGGLPSAAYQPPAPPPITSSAPQGFSVLINNGDEYTNSRDVTLFLNGGPDAKRMAISNFSDFKNAGQETYASTKTWDLCRGFSSCPEREYTIYAKFYTAFGVASEVISDTIILRKEKPIIEKIKEIPEKIVEKIKEIIKPKPPEEIKPPEIPPEELVAEETPAAMQAKWKIGRAHV